MKNCKDITVLVSESQDRELKRFERLKLEFHLLMCPNCKRYSNSVYSMRTIMQRYAAVEKLDDVPHRGKE